jgi:hypothetical protein
MISLIRHTQVQVTMSGVRQNVLSDYELAKKKLNWAPTVEFSSALERLVSSALKNQSRISR